MAGIDTKIKFINYATNSLKAETEEETETEEEEIKKETVKTVEELWNRFDREGWESYIAFLREETVPLENDLMDAFLKFYEKLLEQTSKEEEIERLKVEINTVKNYQSEFLFYLRKPSGWPRVIVTKKYWLRRMPAGSDEQKEDTQEKRLGALSDTISDGLPEICVALSSGGDDLSDWNEVFECINTNKPEGALAAFNEISKKSDQIYRALTLTHSTDYLEEIIRKSSTNKSHFCLGEDLKFNIQTFESNIRQLHALHQGIESKEILQVLVADPTHHAGFEGGSGFCAFNKQMAYIKMMQEKNEGEGFDTHVIQIGLDVNQDNGNKNTWEHWKKKDESSKKRKRGEDVTISCLSHYHIDVYDSRVYPYPNPEKGNEYVDEDTSTVMGSMPSDRGTKIDLSTCEKTPTEIMEHLIDQIREQIELVKTHNMQEGVIKKKVVLSLPIGFDSSVDEKAPCGTCNCGDKIPEESLKRFSREDYDYFFEQLNSIIKVNKDVISGALITLEGGYTLGVSGLEGYVARMLSKLDKHRQDGVVPTMPFASVAGEALKPDSGPAPKRAKPTRPLSCNS